MSTEIIQFYGENYRTESYNKVPDWKFQNVKELQKDKECELPAVE